MKNDKKLYEFLKAAIQYMNNEIELESNNLFRIDGICYKEEVEGQHVYHIKYGTSINGGIELYYVYSRLNDANTINGVVVYVKNKDGKIESLTSSEEINNNPKAIELIDNAIADLNKAKVLGYCVPKMDKGSYLVRHSMGVPSDKGLKRIISKNN